MKAVMPRYTFLGPLLDDYTLQSIDNAKKINESEKKKKREIVEDKYINREGKMVDSTLNDMNEIKDILKKAGISIRYYPFVPVKNKFGEIDFVPKGESLKDIKEDVDAYKEKIKRALDKGKISVEEYEKLNQNLDEMLSLNNIDLEEFENMEVTDAEVNDYLNAVIYRNFGNNYDLNGIKEKYEKSDMDSKEAFLTKFNSEVNKKIGIDGKLTFVEDRAPIAFEDSFNKDGSGYMLSTGDIDVEAKDFKSLLYGMVERSLIRKKEIENQQMMSPEKKKALHEKIMRDKEKREQEFNRKQEKANRNQARKLIRRLERE